MSNPETQNYPPSIKISRCLACNQELNDFKLLICAECLDDDCDNFEKLTRKKGLNDNTRTAG